MTATTITTPAVPSPGRIRPLNLLRDLPAIADLIELCFSATLDPDGRSYINQMRRSGQDSSFLNWAPRVIETVSLPLTGFVWENKGRVVGNVSLIPFSRRGQKVFLIANVATHPEFRRQGIARQLTSAAMQRAREKRADSIWLHVRDDNPGAIQLYQELGFMERCRRTTWMFSSDPLSQAAPQASIQITQPLARDWPVQREWLSRAYPPELDWYHPQAWKFFKPGLLNTLYRLMNDVSIRQWSAYRNGNLQGVVGSQRSGYQADQLWAALPAQPEIELVTALLLQAQRTLMRTRGPAFEYPVGPADEAIQAAGLIAQRTLCWMEAPGAATFQRI